MQHKSQKILKYFLEHHKIFFSTVTIRYTIFDINDASDASRMFIRLSGGDCKADTKNTRNINCTSFSPCQKTMEKHIQNKLIMCLHYVKKCSKSDPIDRLEPAGNCCQMSEVNLEPARLTFWKVSTVTTG